LLLSLQTTKAQVQTCKSIFQFQMKKHKRLKQIMITRGGEKIAAQSTRHFSALVLWNPPPFSFVTLFIGLAM